MSHSNRVWPRALLRSGTPVLFVALFLSSCTTPRPTDKSGEQTPSATAWPSPTPGSPTTSQETTPKPGTVYGIVGDAGIGGRPAANLRQSLNDFLTKRLILPGDNIYSKNDTHQSLWDPWKKEGFEFTVVAIGNHNRSYAAELSYFELPGESYARSEGNNLFLVLNSDNPRTAAAQHQWLRKELERARETNVFIVFHHPPMTVTLDHKWQEKQKFQMGLRPILNDYAGKITALLVGHDHIGGIYDVSGIPMIVSGAGAQVRKPSRAPDGEDNGLRLTTKWLFDGAPTWARLETDPENGEVWVRFVKVGKKKEATCSALISARPMQLVGCS